MGPRRTAEDSTTGAVHLPPLGSEHDTEIAAAGTHVEQPPRRHSAEDAEGCARIRREGAYPVGVGDEVTHITTFRALLDAGALDVLRLDAVSIGGVTPARRVIALAQERGVPVSFHIYPEVSVHLAPVARGSVVETFDPDVPGGNPPL